MNKTSIKRSAQAGFTLIELIVVIVILGILAATALPKFADLGADARLAKMQGVIGALNSAAAIAHGQQLVKGASGSTAVVLEGTTVTMANGYPDSAGIVLAVGGLNDYSHSPTGGVVTIMSDATHTNCKVTYTESASAGVAPVVSVAPALTAC
jgi:MSHA pilin protein MshA